MLAPEGSVPLEMWSGRYFERYELDFAVNCLQPGMTFVDIGANVGLFSIPAAKKLQRGNVYAFEPASSTFQLLINNVRLNQLDNVHLVRSALGDYRGEAVLHLNVPGKDGLNTIGRPTHDCSEVVGTERVPVTTLDAFLQSSGIAHVDLLKVDVEGAELLVFRGAAELLARPDAPLILYESGFLSKGFGYHPVETIWFLERYGFSFFVIDSYTGKISVPRGDGAYGAVLIAVKPAHPSYPAIIGTLS